MKNIFQGSRQFQKCIAESLNFDYKEDDAKYYLGGFTKEFYFQAYFYLSNRFGSPINNENEYKEAGYWHFRVKNFIIQITFLSTKIEIVMFGESKYQRIGAMSPGGVKYIREITRHSNEIIDVGSSCSGEVSDNQKMLIEKTIKEYMSLNNISEDEAFEHHQEELFGCLLEYNNKIINIDIPNLNKTFGETYSNAYTKYALRTLSQFMKNLLTPIWIRDCRYNLLGRCGNEFDKYENNIKIERE